MRAIGVNTYGGPEVLEEVQLPEPGLLSGQIVIRIHAAAVNPTDMSVRNGRRAKEHAKFSGPFVPGMDVAGVVEAIASNVTTDLRPGDRVMAIVLPEGSHGGYSERLALPLESVVRAPVGTTHAEAASLPMNGLTARMALDMVGLRRGQTLAVTGSAGTLGGYVIQLAKDDGARVIADAAPQDESLVRALGADVVVRRGSEVADRIRSVVPGGVDALIDGSAQGEALFDAVRDGGAFASVRTLQAVAPRGIIMMQVWVRQCPDKRMKLERLRELVESGVITLRVAATYPASEASVAHQRFERGGVRGRLVLEF